VKIIVFNNDIPISVSACNGRQDDFLVQELIAGHRFFTAIKFNGEATAAIRILNSPMLYQNYLSVSCSSRVLVEEAPCAVRYTLIHGLTNHLSNKLAGSGCKMFGQLYPLKFINR